MSDRQFTTFESLEKNIKLLTGLRSVRIVKNSDLGLENAENASAFSRPQPQFFTIRTSQPANNIYFSDTPTPQFNAV